MKTTRHSMILFIIMLYILGCTSKTNGIVNTPQSVKTITMPVETKTVAIDPSQFSGRLFISRRMNSNFDEINIIDLSKNTTNTLLSDTQCYFLPNTNKELCFKKCELLPERAEYTCEYMELIDLQTKESIFQIKKKIDQNNIKLSSNGEYLDNLQKVNENTLNVERYSLIDGIKVFEYEVKGFNWGSFPSLSENGNILIGVVSLDGKETLISYDLQSKKAEGICTFENETFIPGIKWAYNSNEFIIQTLSWSEDVTAPCTNILYFDLSTNFSKRIIDRELSSPCFLIDSAVISPDGKKIAIEIDDGLENYGICIYSTDSDQKQCIRNGDQGNRIFSPIWNPTSDSIAYFNASNQVYIYGLDEKQSELITTINEARFMSIFAWIQ